MRALAALLVLVLVPAAAEASCTVTVTPIVFGKYDIFDAAPLDAVGRIVYECTSTVERLRIRIGHTNRMRGLSNGEHVLTYQLFLDPAMTRIWGDETAGTEALYVNAPPAGTSVSVPIFARIPPGQNARVGSYTDTLAILVDF